MFARLIVATSFVMLALSAHTAAFAQVSSTPNQADVQPGSWAPVAMTELINRYGCVEGYPDRTYRANRAVTRYEFASGVNACLARFNAGIEAGGPNSAQDRATVQRLQSEFRQELDLINGRVDSLEGERKKRKKTKTKKLSPDYQLPVLRGQ